MAPCEWVIDIIQDWVLSQAYATIVYVDAEIAALKVWVLEWITPVNVTGDLAPDSTCTYFKAGIHNGKPYYKHSDGGWFLWWYAAPFNEWWISVAVDNTDDGWYRTDPDIEGDYVPWHYSGTATVAVGRKFLCYSFVDRGDPAPSDFALANFTRDSAWHELDLSAIVPAGAKSVLFSIAIVNTGVNRFAYLRRHGNANIWNVSLFISQTANVYYGADVTCPVDNDRKVDYYFTAGGWTTIFVTVKGWWL